MRVFSCVSLTKLGIVINLDIQLAMYYQPNVVNLGVLKLPLLPKLIGKHYMLMAFIK